MKSIGNRGMTLKVALPAVVALAFSACGSVTPETQKYVDGHIKDLAALVMQWKGSRPFEQAALRMVFDSRSARDFCPRFVKDSKEDHMRNTI